MKRIIVILLTAAMLFSAAGCSGDQPAQSAQAAQGAKDAVYIVKNVSGMPWVLDHDDLGYYDDLDAIDVSDFTVEPGGTDGGGVYIEKQKELGNFIETSPKTYEVTVSLLAGAVPDDPEENNQLDKEDFIVTNLKISGTYNEPVIIEWDGSAFKQVN
ncbi:MAG: hypothetical protein AAGU75_03025 [Bacillota bacterium]